MQMFEKKQNAQGDTGYVKYVPSFMKGLMYTGFTLMLLIVGLSIALAIAEWKERHSYFLVIFCSAFAVFAAKKLFTILPYRYPVELTLSKQGITVKRGSEILTQPWQNLGPFEWNKKTLCLEANIIDPTTPNNMKKINFTIPPSFAYKETPSILEEIASIRKVN